MAMGAEVALVAAMPMPTVTATALALAMAVEVATPMPMPRCMYGQNRHPLAVADEHVAQMPAGDVGEPADGLDRRGLAVVHVPAREEPGDVQRDLRVERR